MKIASYNIQSESAHKLTKNKEINEKLEAWTGNERNGSSGEEDPSFIIDIKSNKKLFQYTTEKTYLQNAEDSQYKDTANDAKLKLIESFIYMTTGKRVKLKNPELGAVSAKEPQITDPAAMTADMTNRDNWGLVYEYHEVTAEQESVYFNSAGTVTTSDGRTIAFDLDFSMNRSFFEQQNVSLRMGNAVKMDPLVISLNNQGPQLTANKFAFDLNGDGKTENISFATGGSGFLALDKNSDGVINDGSELFGPESGDGFADLRAYDLDKNGWIDENDEVFFKLSIYSMSENGEKSLFKLGETGIGAIYLNDISTPFEYKDEKGASSGAMTSSSIFLRENGTAGTIHHVDLTI